MNNSYGVTLSQRSMATSARLRMFNWKTSKRHKPLPASNESGALSVFPSHGVWFSSQTKPRKLDCFFLLGTQSDHPRRIDVGCRSRWTHASLGRRGPQPDGSDSFAWGAHQIGQGKQGSGANDRLLPSSSLPRLPSSSQALLFFHQRGTRLEENDTHPREGARER